MSAVVGRRYWRVVAGWDRETLHIDCNSKAHAEQVAVRHRRRHPYVQVVHVLHITSEAGP